MASIPSSSKAPLAPLTTTTARSKSPAKPKSPITDPIDIVQTFINQNPDYKVTYEFTEDGETYQFSYKMGDRVLAKGESLSKKQDAKRCAAQKAERVLRSEGYRLCGNSSKSSWGS